MAGAATRVNSNSVGPCTGTAHQWPAWAAAQSSQTRRGAAASRLAAWLNKSQSLGRGTALEEAKVMADVPGPIPGPLPNERLDEALAVPQQPSGLGQRSSTKVLRSGRSGGAGVSSPHWRAARHRPAPAEALAERDRPHGATAALAAHACTPAAWALLPPWAPQPEGLEELPQTGAALPSAGPQPAERRHRLSASSGACDRRRLRKALAHELRSGGCGRQPDCR